MFLNSWMVWLEPTPKKDPWKWSRIWEISCSSLPVVKSNLISFHSIFKEAGIMDFVLSRQPDRRWAFLKNNSKNCSKIKIKQNVYKSSIKIPITWIFGSVSLAKKLKMVQRWVNSVSEWTHSNSRKWEMEINSGMKTLILNQSLKKSKLHHSVMWLKEIQQSRI